MALWIQPTLDQNYLGEQDFLGGPMVKALCFQCRGTGSISGQGSPDMPSSVAKKKKIGGKKFQKVLKSKTCVCLQLATIYTAFTLY